MSRKKKPDTHIDISLDMEEYHRIVDNEGK